MSVTEIMIQMLITAKSSQTYQKQYRFENHLVQSDCHIKLTIKKRIVTYNQYKGEECKEDVSLRKNVSVFYQH